MGLRTTRQILGSVLAGAAIVCLQGPSTALDIQFDYRYDTAGLFADPAARAALDAAAEPFESVLLDDLSAISASGRNQWEATFFNPSSGANEIFSNLVVPADTLTVFVGGRNLGGDTLGIGGPGGFGGSGTSSWLDTLFGRGEGSQVEVSDIFAIEFGPWGGAISFDTLNSNGQPRNWHFDVHTDPARNAADFYSVAVHELAHVLGFGTADSFDNLVRGGYFEGTQAKSLNDGQPIRMAADNAHWAAETRSPPGDDDAPVAAMDPTIITFNGVMRRRHFTPLDFAALDDLGWDVHPSAYQMLPDPIDGDYNNNGLVEQQDLDLVLASWGSSASAVPPAWTNDPPLGVVDQPELDGVLANWGNSAGSSASAFTSPTAAVPEPATWLLGFVLFLLLFITRAPAHPAMRASSSDS